MPAIILTGLPGTGKSSLAQALAPRLSAHVLSKDRIRSAAFEPNQVAYTLEQDDLIQQWMESAAVQLWAHQPNLWIIFDGRTFSRQYQRARLANLCREQHQKYFFFHLTASESTVRQRLREPHPAANRDFALYKATEAAFEDVLERPCLELSTDQPMEKVLIWALTFLKSAGAH